MTLNAIESSPNHTLSHESINSTDTSNKESNDTIEESMETDVSIESNRVDEIELTNEEQIRETINNVLEKTEEKVSPSSKKKDKDHLDSPKKRSKTTPRKEESFKSSPLIRQPKLQINDKTLKKLRSNTDDLIFENEDEEAELSEPCSNDKLAKNLLPVVNNVLSRSIAAIFKNSTINKNGEFNSYSALGYNKGPRVKRVCRTFSDVYRGLPRAVFPQAQSSSKINKSSSRNKSKKSKNKSSPSTSKSNSNDSTECSQECSLDSEDSTDYIEQNMKKEMDPNESKDDVSV